MDRASAPQPTRTPSSVNAILSLTASRAILIMLLTARSSSQEETYMKRKWIVVAAFAIAISSFLFAQADKKSAKTKAGGGSAEQQIATLEDQSRDAALKADTAFLEKTLADDYVGISGMTGGLMTRDQAIQLRKSGDIKYDSIDVGDRKIRIYGNTAVVTSEATVKGTMKGQDISGDYRGTRVWVKQKGTWKAVSFQTTPIKSR